MLFLAASWPARAVYTCDACVTGTIKVASAAEILNLRQTILGIATVGTPLPLGKNDLNIPIVSPTVPIPYTSLVGYFEHVWWPRLIELGKYSAGNTQKFDSVRSQQQVRVAEAQTQIQHKQTVGQIQVTNAMSALGRANALCIYPSMGQSDLAAHILTLQKLTNYQKVASKEVSGSTETPDYARGPIYYKRQRLEQRKQRGYCVSNGSAGTSQKYCPSNDSNTGNADIEIRSLLENWVLTNGTNEPYSVNTVKAFIENVFPERAFTPLPADVTGANPLPDQATDAIMSQVAYGAVMNVLGMPFYEEMADRTELDGNIASLPSLDAALVRAGYEGAVKEKLTRNGKVSRAALEYIRYKVYEHDPQSVITDLAGVGGTSVENITSIIATKQMKQITLLYDIREQIKRTNMLLGSIGSILAKGRYDEIEQTITGVSASEGQ